VRFEDGPQPPNLLDECLQRLELLAPALALLHLSPPVGFLPRTQLVDGQPGTQKDQHKKWQGKPQRLRDQVAHNLSD